MAGGYEGITQWIATGAVDLGFVILPAYESLDVVSLHDDQMVVLLPEHHPLRKRRSLQIEHLADEPFIMPKSGCDMFLKKLFKEKGLKPKR
ncbi:LysR family transcriptional regulator substrate-binding protein [Paenibacillus sp. P26]|nr:LysR family transcriptional regulator substrate-binding protein [Paenibacillus sp. P26]UUZ97508.1 LysR family transcriptional regulator substrate-binding protein [Paenibacillus sp. P25]